MTKDVPTVHLDPDSELARALDAADDAPFLLVSNGVHFRVIRAADDLWANYDPEAVLVALRAVAGTMSAEEGERVKQRCHADRREASRLLATTSLAAEILHVRSG